MYVNGIASLALIALLLLLIGVRHLVRAVRMGTGIPFENYTSWGSSSLISLAALTLAWMVRVPASAAEFLNKNVYPLSESIFDIISLADRWTHYLSGLLAVFAAIFLVNAVSDHLTLKFPPASRTGILRANTESL
jgi:hypothetical protein